MPRRNLARRMKRNKKSKSMKLVWKKRREQQKKSNLSGNADCTNKKKSLECDKNQKRDFIAVYVQESVRSQNIRLELKCDENDIDPLVDFKVEPLGRTNEYQLKCEQNYIDDSLQDIKEEPDVTSEYELLIEDIGISPSSSRYY